MQRCYPILSYGIPVSKSCIVCTYAVVHIEPSVNGEADVDIIPPSNELKAEVDVPVPDGSGSLKTKGKGGFKLPSFNKKDKKLKIDKDKPGKGSILLYLDN